MTGNSCAQCGSPLPLDAKFCGACGFAIGDASHAASDSDQQTWWPTGEGTPGASAVAVLPPPPAGTPDPPPSAALPPRPVRVFDIEPVVLARAGRRAPFLILTAIVLLGIAGGAVAVLTGSDDAPPAVATQSVGTVGAGTVVMPSVKDLTFEQAQAQLKDAGIENAAIKRKNESREDVAPGTVVAQVPGPGTPVTGTVTLTVAIVPAKMPKYVSLSVDEARAKLELLGVTVRIAPVIDVSVTDGTVITQEPAAGAAFAKEVTLGVARAPVETALGDLDGDGSRPSSTDEVEIGGQTFTEGVYWSVSGCADEPKTGTLALGGQFRKLQGTAGLTSGSDAGFRARLEIKADGVSLYAGTLDTSSKVPIDVDITGRNVLEFVLSPVGAPPDDCPYGYVALGNGRLLSVRGDIKDPANP